MLLYGRNPHNVVRQVSSSQEVNLKNKVNALKKRHKNVQVVSSGSIPASVWFILQAHKSLVTHMASRKVPIINKG